MRDLHNSRGGFGVSRGDAVRLLLAAACWCSGVSTGKIHAQGGAVSEYDVKAAFLAKIPAFVRWPSSGTGVTVGVLGDDPFGGALDKIVKVRRAKRVEDLKGCQIIFISKSERGNLAEIFSALEGSSILTVGDSDGFAKQGGVIGFTVEKDKVRFEINLAAARRGRLEVNPDFVQLARRIYKS